MGRKYQIVVAAAVSNEMILEQNLAASPMIREKQVEFVVERNHPSASAAYNAVLSQTNADIVVFAHQDVYLPRGWEARLQDTIRCLDEMQKKWAILGAFGIDQQNQYVGRVWACSFNRELGSAVTAPTPVLSIDEMLIILRRDTGLTFDPNLPGYHLYGADLVQMGFERGFETYVFDGPCIHNSDPKFRHYFSYYKAYRYMQKKWSAKLPISTTSGPVAISQWPACQLILEPLRRRMRNEIHSHHNGRHGPCLAREIGYE